MREKTKRRGIVRASSDIQGQPQEEAAYPYCPTDTDTKLRLKFRTLYFGWIERSKKQVCGGAERGRGSRLARQNETSSNQRGYLKEKR